MAKKWELRNIFAGIDFFSGFDIFGIGYIALHSGIGL